MNKLFVDLGMENIDRSFVIRCSSQIDVKIAIWKSRALDKRHTYIWLDAIYTKIRTEHGAVSTALLIAIGVKEDGRRDVLGLHLGIRESAMN